MINNPAGQSLTFDTDSGQLLAHDPPPDLATWQAQAPPVPPPLPPPPDIVAIITALANSPSLDQPTKDALISALKGQ